MPTSSKGKTAHADNVDTTSNDIETFGDEVREHFCPGEARSNFDGPFFLIEDDVSEKGHRDLDTRGRGKIRVSGVPGTLDREGRACETKLPKLQYLRSAAHQDE